MPCSRSRRTARSTTHCASSPASASNLTDPAAGRGVQALPASTLALAAPCTVRAACRRMLASGWDATRPRLTWLATGSPCCGPRARTRPPATASRCSGGGRAGAADRAAGWAWAGPQAAKTRIGVGGVQRRHARPLHLGLSLPAPLLQIGVSPPARSLCRCSSRTLTRVQRPPSRARAQAGCHPDRESAGVDYRGGTSAPGRWPMLDDLAYDDSEPPTIGLVPAGVPRDELKDHIKIAHSPLLAGAGASGQYAGAYWAGTELVVADDLGPDQQQALREFRTSCASAARPDRQACGLDFARYGCSTERAASHCHSRIGRGPGQAESSQRRRRHVRSQHRQAPRPMATSRPVMPRRVDGRHRATSTGASR
jgi:hypothetical protein